MPINYNSCVTNHDEITYQLKTFDSYNCMLVHIDLKQIIYTFNKHSNTAQIQYIIVQLYYFSVYIPKTLSATALSPIVNKFAN